MIELKYIVPLLIVLFAIYVSAVGTDTDPEGMIIQSMLFPMAILIWSFLIFKFMLDYSWIGSMIIAFVLSMVIPTIWRLMGDMGNKKIGYFITNLVTFPLWYPAALFGKNKITEKYLQIIMIPAMGLFKVFNLLTSFLDPNQIRMFE